MPEDILTQDATIVAQPHYSANSAQNTTNSHTPDITRAEFERIADANGFTIQDGDNRRGPNPFTGSGDDGFVWFFPELNGSNRDGKDARSRREMLDQFGVSSSTRNTAAPTKLFDTRSLEERGLTPESRRFFGISGPLETESEWGEKRHFATHHADGTEARHRDKFRDPSRQPTTDKNGKKRHQAKTLWDNNTKAKGMPPAYGLNHIEKGERVYLVNSELAVWLFWQHNLRAICPLGESRNAKSFAAIIQAAKDKGAAEILVLFDADTTGQSATETALKAARAVGLPASAKQWREGVKRGFDASDFREECHAQSRDFGAALDELRDRDEPQPETSAEARGHYELNEIGNGARFASEHAGALRFSSTDERWRFYKNGVWQEDNHGEAERRAKQTAKKFAADAVQEIDDDKRGRLLKHAVTLTKRSVRETMLKDAASEPGMAATLEDFDVNLDLFNCSNGTLNLSTREFWQHSPKDLLTRKSPVRYDSEATCPLWRRCVERWISDTETREFIQEIVGITLSGRVYEEFFMFLYGEGDNGKSKFLGTVEFLLGSYFHKTKAETVMQSRQKRSASAPAQEILELKGARGVGTHEIDEKQEINTALIKDLTGRDSITARGVYAKRETTFSPQFTLWMFGNGKPLINDPSGGMWRRPKLINFGAPIPKAERDPQLGQKLEAESSGILNWALEGLARVEKRGGKIETPKAVEAAIKSYRDSQDPLASFLEEVCYIGPEHSAASSEIFEAWRGWCKENGYEAGNPHTLFTALGRGSSFRDCKVSRRGKQVRGWRGISIFNPSSQEQNTLEI